MTGHFSGRDLGLARLPSPVLLLAVHCKAHVFSQSLRAGETRAAGWQSQAQSANEKPSVHPEALSKGMAEMQLGLQRAISRAQSMKLAGCKQARHSPDIGGGDPMGYSDWPPIIT